MDAAVFDRLTRIMWRIDMPSRRGLLGLAAGSLLGAAGLVHEAAGKRKKKKCTKKIKKTCGPCRKCKKGKCKPKPNGPTCINGKVCFTNSEGVCVPCTVCPSGCRFKTLQDAVDEAKAGATIQLCPGAYRTVFTDVYRGVEVIGAGSGSGGTVLDGQGRDGVLAVSEGVAMRHLTITGGASDFGGGGAICIGSSITFEDVHFTNNLTSRQGGAIWNIGEVTLRNCEVTGNSAASGGGIYNTANSEGPGGILTLTEGTVVTGNTGGGIVNSGGVVTVTGGSSVTGNTPFNCSGTVC